jgi:uncharacterized membrane protein YccC
MGAIGSFWISSEWPGGGLAMIGAAVAVALSSNSPNPTRFVMQMAIGAMIATVAGYIALRFLYPHIDGFPLLCFVLAPILAFGANLATRPRLTGCGVSFSIFFCVLAGPDNVINYAPESLMNNGLAVVLAMLVCVAVFCVVFPVQMPWRSEALVADLRSQVRLAATAPLANLNQAFQSGTHDLMSQLRSILPRQSRTYKRALSWMLLVLEVGHAAIDLRNETAEAAFMRIIGPDWERENERMMCTLSVLFEEPGAKNLRACLGAVDSQIKLAQRLLESVHGAPQKITQVRRMLGCLHFMRSTLGDGDALFNAR